MMNEKDEQAYKAKFGSLMTRYAILMRVIKDYEKEVKSVQKELDDLVSQIVGKEESDGKSVQQA